MKKLLAILLSLCCVLACFAGCGDNPNGPKDEDIDLNDAVAHANTESVYDRIGPNVTIDMVEEDANGMAFVTYEGKTYELGMDFLSMAMVYNCSVPANHAKYQSAEDVYNEWWKLYIQRWNYLVPEIPLYSNTYYDLYNAKIEGFETTPYWGPADAIVSSTVKAGSPNKVILGSSTDLSGAFRNSSWGKTNPGASDLDIQNLTSGYATVLTNKAGAMEWNEVVLAETPSSVVNQDGTLTYTIKIKDDLKFSDGSAINAKNYIAGLLCNSSPVGVAAGGTGTSGTTVVGYDAFKEYDGTNDGAAILDKKGNETGGHASKFFSGVRLLGDYEFSVTFTADYAGYYYSQANAGFSPDPLALYIPQGEIIVDPETKSVGLSQEFYAQEEIENKLTYTAADKIIANLKWNSNLPYSGPYTVSNYDESTKTATLSINSSYPGDNRGKPSIEEISYVKIVSETQLDQFKQGQVDVLAGITGGTDTEAALAIVKADPSKYAETHYDRAGYGKLGFRCDFGPTAFLSVRQAIMYTINRPEFAQTFTGGHGSVVHGPYYGGSAAFQAVKDEIKLNQYAYSVDSAIEALEDGGWTYNDKGEQFDASKDAIRYKKLSGYELTKDNLGFATVDGKYKTLRINGSYYMPLAINWFGTQPNDVTDQLLTAWAKSPQATTEIGMYITYTASEFNPALYGELFRMEAYGYNGIPKLNAVNFATGFNSAIYDYSFNWAIDPILAENYQMSYLFDEADFAENYD